MFGNGVEIILIYRQILGPLVLGWAPNHFLLEAQLAPGEKRSVCIPVIIWVFTVFQSMHSGVTSIQRVKGWIDRKKKS